MSQEKIIETTHKFIRYRKGEHGLMSLLLITRLGEWMGLLKSHDNLLMTG